MPRVFSHTLMEISTCEKYTHLARPLTHTDIRNLKLYLQSKQPAWAAWNYRRRLPLLV